MILIPQKRYTWNSDELKSSTLHHIPSSQVPGQVGLDSVALGQWSPKLSGQTLETPPSVTDIPDTTLIQPSIQTLRRLDINKGRADAVP